MRTQSSLTANGKNSKTVTLEHPKAKIKVQAITSSTSHVTFYVATQEKNKHGQTWTDIVEIDVPKIHSKNKFFVKSFAKPNVRVEVSGFRPLPFFPSTYEIPTDTAEHIREAAKELISLFDDAQREQVVNALQEIGIGRKVVDISFAIEGPRLTPAR